MNIKGGSAIPVVVVTDAKVQDNLAYPVYGYQTKPTDRAVIGGKARRVKVITAADLKQNGGQYTLVGSPQAMPVYTDPSGVTDGGTAIAVYPVNAWPGASPVIPGGLVLPQVASATLLLDLRASQLALSDGNPVSTWADASGLHNDFTQSGAARPAYRAGGGVPYVQGDGVDDWMLGPDFADGLTDFAIFAVYDTSLSATTALISKITTIGDGQGWLITPNNEVVLQENGGSHWIGQSPSPLISTKHVYASLIVGGWANSNVKIYRDGIEVPAYNSAGPDLIAAITNAQPVRLFTDESDGDYFGAPLYAMLIYAPAPSLPDMVAISNWLMVQNGIVVGSAPTFVSAEIGNLNASTVTVTFSDLATAVNFANGVTVTINGVPQVAASGAVLVNPVVQYGILIPASTGDVVTWAYAKSSGDTMGLNTGTLLDDVSAQPVTNNL